jgi:hypothetical protein
VKLDAKQIKTELVAAGFEVYRTRPDEVQVAERVRLHIMDSGIRVWVKDEVHVAFTVRQQRSDFPDVPPETLIDRARREVGRLAQGRGYVETQSGSVEVKDPMDASRVLDVWHEVTYEKPIGDLATAVDEVRWALSIERFLGRTDDPAM